MGIPILLALLLSAGVAGAQCHADRDGSGAVEIHELIAAVNEALGGCGAVTPTRTATPIRTPTADAPRDCMVRFTDDNTADDAPYCVFRQSSGANAECPGIEYAFFSDGEHVVAAINAPVGVGYYGARPSWAQGAAVFARWTRQDVGDRRTAGGSLLLGDDGERLRVSIGTVICGDLNGRFVEHRFRARPDIRAMLAALR